MKAKGSMAAVKIVHIDAGMCIPRKLILPCFILRIQPVSVQTQTLMNSLHILLLPYNYMN